MRERTFFKNTHRMVTMSLILIIVMICFIAGSVIVKADNKKSDAAYNMRFSNCTVEQGDTLWSIAETYMDDIHYDSIYDYMEELRSLNHLTSDQLVVGQNLLVTYYVEITE